ncbi:MAG: class II fructose-bisphosphate aldolase, partial [Oscillospiraceae bacterium]|nr:class II fructose-bisphosphate aldolase [Oscillospiraceae bacterium]
MFVSSIDMIKKAKAGGYAVPAFNAENMEMAQAIVAAAEEANSP